MPPKRRARKLATPLVVPPKKRKAVREIFPEASEEGKLIPEWLKVSIQILLINFHSEGVALLNSIQSEYEAVYKDNKVNPREYDFQDWESMLKSSQCKSHFLVYIDKKIPRVKGYPLPRSAAIYRNNYKWTIDPRIEQEMEPQRSENDPGPSKPYNCVIMGSTIDEDDEVMGTEEPSKAIDSSDKVPLPFIVNSGGSQSVRQKVNNFKSEGPNLEPPVQELIKAEPPQLEEMNCDLLIDTNIEKTPLSNKYDFIPKKKRAFVHWNMKGLTNNTRVSEIIPTDQDSKKIPIILINTDPPSLIGTNTCHKPLASLLQDKTEEVSISELESIGELEDFEETQNGDLIVDKNPENSLMADSAKSPDADRFSPKPLPSRYSMTHDPEILELPFPKQFKGQSHSDTSPLEDLTIQKNRSQRDNHDPEVRTFVPIERILSKNVDNVECCDQPENSVIYTKWKAFRICLENARVHHIRHIVDSSRGSLHEETVINLQNDPRLINGFRASGFANFNLKEMEMIKPETDSESDLKFPDSEETVSISNNVFGKIIPQNIGSIEDGKKPIVAIAEESNARPMSKAKITLPTLFSTSEPPPNFRYIIHPPPPPPPIGPLDSSICIAGTSKSLKTSNNTLTAARPYSDIQNPIPQDNFDIKCLKFADLWSDTKWKLRFMSDKVPCEKFYKSNVYSRWKEVWKNYDSSKYRKELIQELQKYEDRPYPSRCQYFLRSSLRMVEIDFLTKNQFSDPKGPGGEILLKRDDILYYVDFAGAPGGVIEFYNTKRRWSSKGFGVTYQKRSYNVYALPDVIPEYFEAFYGKLNTMNGDGSLFCAETVHIFVTRVMEATQGQGVHVVTTVGNVARVVFEDDNDEKWRYQHLAQIMVALRVLREGGNMAFKMYEIKSAFAAGLLYLIYRTFEHVQIAKLNIFAPTSGERVVICLGRRSNEDIQEIQRYLQECHKIMADWYLKKETGTQGRKTIEELVPFCKLEQCKEFFEYLTDSNERLKRAQLEEFDICLNNLKIYGSIFSKGLYRAFVAKTTEIWKTGERPPRTRIPGSPVEAFQELGLQPGDVCEAVETILNRYNLHTIFSCPRNWRCLPLGNQSKTRGFYMGVDGIPYFLNMKYKRWVPVRQQEFCLPSKTLVYGELVTVFSKDRKVESEIFSIIDGVSLGGNDIRDLPYSQRMKQCEKFSTIVTKCFFPKMTRIKVTKAQEFFSLPLLLMMVESLSLTSSPSQQQWLNKPLSLGRSEGVLVLPSNSVFSGGLSIPGGNPYWFTPSGVLFIETDTSNTTGFCSTLLSRVLWEWVANMDLPMVKSIQPSLLDIDAVQEENCPIGSVSAEKITNFIYRNVNEKPSK